MVLALLVLFVTFLGLIGIALALGAAHDES